MKTRLMLVSSLLTVVAGPLALAHAGTSACTPNVNREVPHACVHYQDSECFLCVEPEYGASVDTTVTTTCRIAPTPVKEALSLGEPRVGNPCSSFHAPP